MTLNDLRKNKIMKWSYYKVMSIENIMDELIAEAESEPEWKAVNALRTAKKELMKEQVSVEPDYKKYISIEWLKKYATLCCTFDMNTTAIHFVETWLKMNEE